MDYQNYIDGRWLASSDGKTFEQRNPANLEEVTGHWPKSTREDAKQAIESSHAAFADWAGIGVHKRAEYLSKATLDWTDDAFSPTFKFDIPNTKSCGCGNSFTLEE